MVSADAGMAVARKTDPLLERDGWTGSPTSGEALLFRITSWRYGLQSRISVSLERIGRRRNLLQLRCKQHRVARDRHVGCDWRVGRDDQACPRQRRKDVQKVFGD